jgi:LysM repeat protein
MKKGKLTETEKACIEGMIASDVNIEDMATQLDRSVPIIEKEAEKIKSQSVRNQLYINKTASGHKGVSIMTEAASTRGDTVKDKASATPTSKETKRSSWVHKIHE